MASIARTRPLQTRNRVRPAFQPLPHPSWLHGTVRPAPGEALSPSAFWNRPGL